MPIRVVQQPGPPPAQEKHEHHASVGFYWMIGIILAVITGIEVAIFYIPAIGAALIPSLLVLSIAKFVIVVMFSGLLFLRNASHAVGLTLLIGGAIATFVAFYSWLTAPLE